jgi:hypothetical protein
VITCQPLHGSQQQRPDAAVLHAQSVLAPSPELGVLPEDDDEDNDFVVDLDEILAAATQEEAAQQEQASCVQRPHVCCLQSSPIQHNV